MPHLDHKGPEGQGPMTGRGLGKCKGKKKSEKEELGKGLGLRRQSGGGEGKKRRLKSAKILKVRVGRGKADHLPDE